MTVRQVWQYGKERGEETYSPDHQRRRLLPLTQNRLFCPGIVKTANGTYAKVIEISYPDKEVIFEATLHFKNLLAPPDTAFADNIYRSFRISIYPKEPAEALPSGEEKWEPRRMSDGELLSRSSLTERS